MKGKMLNISFWIFALLPFLIAIILLLILPETVPIHWTSIRQGPDRYGSKLIVLIIPALFFMISFGSKIVMKFVENGIWEGNTIKDRTVARYTPAIASFTLFGVSLWLFWLIASAV